MNRPQDYIAESVRELSRKTLSILVDREPRSLMASGVAIRFGLPASSFFHAPRCLFDLACVKLVLECDYEHQNPEVVNGLRQVTNTKALRRSCYRRFLRDYHQLIREKRLPSREGKLMFDDTRCHFPEEYLHLYDERLALRGTQDLIVELYRRIVRNLKIEEQSLSLESIAAVADFLLQEPFSNFWRDVVERLGAEKNQPA